MGMNCKLLHNEETNVVYISPWLNNKKDGLMRISRLYWNQYLAILSSLFPGLHMKMMYMDIRMALSSGVVIIEY